MDVSKASCVAKQPGSEYFDGLSVSDKRRYLEKTKDTGDPYCFSLDLLSSEDLPAIRSHDIFNYLVLSTSFCTSDRFKAYKSMESYKYFISGFVSNVRAKRFSECYVVLGKVSCKFSHRLNRLLYKLWFT